MQYEGMWVRDWRGGGRYTVNWNIYNGYINSCRSFLGPVCALVCVLGRVIRFQRFYVIQKRVFMRTGEINAA